MIFYFLADDGSTKTDIESKTQSDGVTSLSINGCGSFESVNVASFRIEITISLHKNCNKWSKVL